jgi:glycosyltransferase involved in cell wall biosynthesis
MERSKLSVALCTYNGEKYLESQLQSLVDQTRRPDETVIVDDNSSDRTYQILKSFARNAPFEVRLYQNVPNLGVSRNFDRAINLCAGDWIALADQDDFWKPEKLARLEAEANREPERTGGVFSNADVVDSALQPLGYTIWDRAQFTEPLRRIMSERGALELLLRKEVVTGATLMFHRRHLAQVSPIPPRWIHDAWIALVISAFAEIRFLPESLILYRQHENNVIGARRVPLTKKLGLLLGRRLELRHAYDYRETLRRLEEREASPAIIRSVREKVAHHEMRENLPKGPLRRLIPISLDLMRRRYQRFSPGVRTAFVDLLAR